MAVLMRTHTVSLTNQGGIVIIPAGSVPNANMQFDSPPSQNSDFAFDGITDGRSTYSVRVDNPSGDTWPTPGDNLTVLASPADPRLVGDWEIIRLETGGFSTLLLYVKKIIETEPV